MKSHIISVFHIHGYKEGGHALRKLFSGLVTDTSTQERHLVPILIS